MLSPKRRAYIHGWNAALETLARHTRKIAAKEGQTLEATLRALALVHVCRGKKRCEKTGRYLTKQRRRRNEERLLKPQKQPAAQKAA